jgi:AcrR family transcriptional regulator
MQPSQSPGESPDAVPADIRARVKPAVLDELTRWGVERFSVEALAERHDLDAAMVYRYWGNRQRLIVDGALADVETWSLATDTGSLRGDLAALARNLTDRINTEVGRIYLRALVMDRRGHHDDETRMMFWRAQFAIVALGRGSGQGAWRTARGCEHTGCGADCVGAAEHSCFVL